MSRVCGRIAIVLLPVAGALFGPVAHAHAATMAARSMAAASWAPVLAAHHAGEMSEGEVRRIEKRAGKVTLRHGPLAHLDMAAMTMAFQVSDKAMLDQVKVGEKVWFHAEKIGSQFVVTRMQSAQ